MTVTAVAPSTVGVSVGDFFVSQWGYEQTNVDFYKVVGLTAKGVKVQKWQGATVRDNGGPVTYVIPGGAPATYTDWSGDEPKNKPCPIRTKRLSCWGTDPTAGGVYIRVSSFQAAQPWDGKPCYQTGSGWGH